MHHALDSVAELENIEVDKQTYADSAQAHVGKDLGFVYRVERRRRTSLLQSLVSPRSSRCGIRPPVSGLHKPRAAELRSPLQTQGLSVLRPDRPDTRFQEVPGQGRN